LKPSYTLYCAIVTATLLFIWLLLRGLMIRMEKKKTKLLEKRNNLESTTTDSPIDDNYEEALSRGLENIETRFSFFRRFTFPLIFGLWLLLLLIPFLDGASKTYTSILVAILTVFISMAAKPYVENLFAGMVVSFSNAVRIGDTVEVDGFYGTVEEINLTYTTIKLWDWKRYLVPNSTLISKEFLNYSLNDRYVWASIEFFVEPTVDLDQLERELIAATKLSAFFDSKNYEEPNIWYMGTDKDSIKLWLAAWAKNPSQGWSLKSDMRKALVQIMKRNGWNFHLSQMNIHNPPSSLTSLRSTHPREDSHPSEEMES